MSTGGYFVHQQCETPSLRSHGRLTQKIDQFWGGLAILVLCWERGFNISQLKAAQTVAHSYSCAAWNQCGDCGRPKKYE
jgi:hypothetical protein